MFRKTISVAVAVAILLAVFIISSTPVFAQPSFSEAGIITLSDLGETEVTLSGPYDSNTIVFGLPADWSLVGGAQLDLNLTSALVGSSATDDGPQMYGGLLIVSFNRQTIAVLPLNSLGATEEVIDIPAYLFVSPRTDGRMELRFELDSGDFCLSNNQTNVIINQNTRITFPYEQVPPSTDLAAFPYPIYQDTIYPDSALIVVPDAPTSAEMQAALSVAAGFGNFTSSKVVLDITTLSALTDEQKVNQHLIFVGNAASLPVLEELSLSLLPSNGSFILSDLDNGVVQMANSPWSVSKVAFVVSGNTEVGVLKAAQAVSTGSLQVNSSPNLAIVDTVRDTPVQSTLVIDTTLADLGNDVEVFDDRGVSSVEYDFYVPAGSAISSDAFFELAYGHSALLNMATSGIVVTLNGQSIGSYRFSDLTAAEGINTVRFSLPQTLALPGNNQIGVRVSLDPVDNCSDPGLEGLFANVWPESRLFVPFTSIQLDTVSRLDLNNYPAPFSFDATMSGIAFVLQQDDLNTWKNALQVAKYLGDRSNGPISMPKVFLDGDFSDADLVDYNLIVMGVPSQMSVMEGLNPSLPVPFDLGTDQVSNTYSQVTYLIDVNTPQGYVELFSSPWNSEKLILATLGNTPDGVTWASSAIGDSPLRGQLAGNFAVINNTQVETLDTRLGQVADSSAPSVEEPAVQLPSAQQQQPFQSTEAASQLDRPSWIFPALLIFGALIVITLIIILMSNARKGGANR